MTDPNRHAILILDGVSAYNSIGAFNREVARVIREATTGLDVVMLDMSDTNRFNDGLRQALEDYPERIGAAFSFSGFGVEIGAKSGNGNLWQRLQIPMLSWMLDHPAYYLARHKSPAAAVMRLYANRDFLEFHRDYVRSPYRTAYCRFGAMTYGRQPYRREPKAGETPLVICPKSGNNPALLEETWKLLPRMIRKVIRDAIDHYWGQTARSGNVVNSVLAAADGAGVELRNDLTLFTFFVMQLDDYIRRSKADILVRQLLATPVRIYGDGLTYIDTSKARATILPPVDYDTLTNLFFESFAVISMNPNIDDECNDRPYSAMGSGALPISDINPWWQKSYPALMPYSYDFRDCPVTAVVEKVLADPKAEAEDAWQQSQQQRRTRTFDTMIEEALEFALTHRYFTFKFEPPQPYFTKCGD